MRIIGGSARGRKLIAPRDDATRPALDRVRESIFSILGSAVEGARVLDLFAGVGAFGLEAASRGARSVLCVEKSRDAIEILRRNVINLGFHAIVSVEDADAFLVPGLLPARHESYDVVFVDPPFAMFATPGGVERVTSRIAGLLESAAVSPGGVVVLRVPAKRTLASPFPLAERRIWGESEVLFLRNERAAAS